jgi:hypothetical protein
MPQSKVAQRYKSCTAIQKLHSDINCKLFTDFLLSFYFQWLKALSLSYCNKWHIYCLNNKKTQESSQRSELN